VTGALALHTVQECLRSPLPYVVGVTVLLLTLASRLFLSFSFGAADIETQNLAMSAVFLAGFALAALQGTALVRRDLEAGTLGLLLSKPVSLTGYVLFRFLGAAAAVLVTCLGVGIIAVVMLAALAPTAEASAGALIGACLRALPPVLVLQAIALAASAAAPRTAAPLLLVAVFVAGSLGSSAPFTWIFPDFSLFGLEAATSSPEWPPLLAYTATGASLFLVLAYIVLTLRAPLRSQS
jgi:ABC-type transport system involved in multi-copper enzyme maturation permease subunit